VNKNEFNFKIRVGVAILHCQHILVLEEEAPEHGRYLSLPGGALKFGETIEEAAVREVKEETGLDIKIDELIALDEVIPPDNTSHQIGITLLAHKTGGRLHLEGQILRAQWLSLDEFAACHLLNVARRDAIIVVVRKRHCQSRYIGNTWSERYCGSGSIRAGVE